MATIPRVPTVNATSYTLDSQLAAAGSTLTLNQSVAGVVRAPGYIVIDRVDSAGNLTTTKREYIKFTGVSTTDLTGLTRGLAGSTDQVHAVGAIVEIVPDVLYEQDWYDAMTTEHSTTGTHGNISITGLLASGASLAGVTSMTPVWTYVGNISAATTIATPLIMPKSGTIDFINGVLRTPSSDASLQINILKNGVGILGTLYPTILAGGTYISTASIATKGFNAGDVFTAASVTGVASNGNDLAVSFHAR